MAPSYEDWLFRGRENQLTIAKKWRVILAGRDRDKWNIPAEQAGEIDVLVRDAEDALAVAKTRDRTDTDINIRCRQTFDALTVKMKDIKNRYFQKPPLTDEDFANLGINPPDAAASNPVPSAQAQADMVFPGGAHLVELINIRAAGGNAPDPQGGYGVRMFWGLTGEPTETDKLRITEPPKSGSDLPHSKFTRRKKERFCFDGESGNMVYFCLRYENTAGQAGPPSPILSAVIP